jgi:hypothetical protein
MAMAYSVPALLIFQEFGVNAPATQNNRTAIIIGGHAALFRYAIDDEKAVINLGEYESGVDTNYLWPERPTGSQVDFDYVKLFIDNALLLYYDDPASAGGVIAPVADHPNRIRSESTVFKTNGIYDRSVVFLDRDVRVGDVARVRGVAASVTYELLTTVSGFVGEPIAAIIDSVVPADTNADNDFSASATVEGLGLINAITVTADPASYDGLRDGDVIETYRIEVTGSSIGGDLTTAKLRITSGSGHDDDSDVTPSEAGIPTAIGARGLYVTFDVNETASTSSVASEENISEDDLVVGQVFLVTVHQRWVAPNSTSAGDYTGDQDTTYIVEVIRGGLWDPDNGEALISVTTTTGNDSSGPTAAPHSTALPVGTKGVTIQFTRGSSTGLRKGDVYYIDVTAEQEGSMQTLVLADDVPTEIQDAADLDLKLYIRKNIQVPQGRASTPGTDNWDTSDTEFSVFSDIDAYDSTWTDNGVEQPLLVKGGTAYVEYRAWLSTYVGDVGSVSDPGDIPALVGTIHQDNPLAEGLFRGTLLSGGQDVLFTAVADPSDLDEWSNAIDKVSGRADIYNLVPMTYDRQVHDLCKAMALAESGKNRFKACFVCPQVDRTKAVVSAETSSDGNVVLATIADDPLTSGTQYTRLSVPAGNARFVTNGVRANDVVRFKYLIGLDGEETWTESLVDEVLSESTLRLATGAAVAISVAQRIEVWRNLRGSDLATESAHSVGRYAHRRVCAVANDTFVEGSETFPGFFLAATIAGLRSAALQHRPLTRVALSGMDDVGSLIKSLTDVQLDQIGAAGGWIVIRALDGSFITRHALTTDMTSLNTQEEVVRVNVDAISAALRDGLEPYIGRTLVTPQVLINMRSTVEGILLEQTKITASDLGNALLDYVVKELRQHATEKDHVILRVGLTIGYPTNRIDAYLEV